MEATISPIEYDEELFLEALDKGIDDMEAGRLVPHKEAVEIMKQRLRDHVKLQNSGN